ncbi:Self-incompatibility protein [Trema orientale]|uniref:S-protein homolog n=1 Tax=Trema orientale TaxID=63057 RepID=A0A2P5CYG6_TREOI|nr:Self-incompatibility protein [Trema orientale]
MNQIGKQALLLFAFLLKISSWEAAIGDPIAKSTRSTDDDDHGIGGKWGIGRVKTTVQIYNNLGDGLNLSIHCKSKDDDLGFHEVKNNEFYEWSFHVNFAMTTLFFCTLSWRDSTGTFDMFKTNRDINRCVTLCTWRAKTDALHGYKQDDQENEDVFITWPPK